MNSTNSTVSLRTKLFTFVGITSLLVLAAAGAGFYYYSNIEAANLMKEEVSKTVEKVLETRVAEKTFLQFYKAEFKTKFSEKAVAAGSGLEELNRSAGSEEWKKSIAMMVGEFANYRKLFDELTSVHDQQSALNVEMIKPLQESEKFLQRIQQDIESKQAQLQMEGETLSPREFATLNVVKDCKAAFIHLQNLQLQYLTSADKKFIQEYKNLANGNVQAYITALEQFATALKNDSWQKMSVSLRQSLAKFLESIERSQGLVQKESEGLRDLNDSGTKVVEIANVFLGQVNRSISSQKSSAIWMISGILFMGLGIFWGLSFVLVRSITRPINAAIGGLTEVSEQVGAASDQVSQSSQELAEGSSKQAAAVEQTSSSLEEMSAMTRQNAVNADQANRLMAEAKKTIAQANESMSGLTVSMGEITGASVETRKIIKTIDEVAFQTNLLALNAAVEAARAGEAGAGFAVVADEVRNLAMRAADAAKNTASLIDATVKTVQGGAGLVERTNDEFSRVALSVSKVGELVGEIAAASQEQSQGIDQINKAVTEMDRLIQMNAANAEESAAASRQMTNRAEQMREFVDNLAGLVKGGGIKTAHTGNMDEAKPGGGIRGLLSAAVPGLSGKERFRPESGEEE